MGQVLKINFIKPLILFGFLLGPFFLALGLTIGATSQWTILPLGFITAGVVICLFWVLVQAHKSQFWQQRSTQSNTNAVIAILAFLTILGLINFLGNRYQIRLDLTETQLFTLAPQSQEILRTLPQPAKLWLFTREKNPEDQELLQRYGQQNPQFSFEYVDPQTRPGLAEKFGVNDFGKVYLEFNNKHQFVQNVNENERLSEVKLTSQLQKIISKDSPKVYLLQGHGELEIANSKNTDNSMSQAIQGLTDNNFTPLPLSLTQQTTVPPDARVVLIASPKRELLPGEITALENYLNIGGNLMLMIDPNHDPKLDTLLKSWGVQLDNRLAIDITGGNLGLGPASPLITEYGQHPITQDFRNGISFYPIARPILIEPTLGIQSTPLLRTKAYPDSWAESDQENEKLEFNEGKDLKGPLTLGVALTKKLASPMQENSPAKTGESRLVIFGNSQFARDGLFQQQLNGDVFLNSVSWLSQKEEQPLSIRPKEQTNRRIIMSNMKANLLGVSSLLVLPLIGFLSSVVIWWFRR
jgi:ABC-type uncharacterized transport system involved in gliding motility auxiliary subunit